MPKYPQVPVVALPTKGQVYYDTDTRQLYAYDGRAWIIIDGGTKSHEHI